MKKILISLPVDLFNKVDLTAKAFWVTRSDYIRQALARAIKHDEEFVSKEAHKLAKSGVQPVEEDDEDTKLLKKYGLY